MEFDTLIAESEGYILTPKTLELPDGVTESAYYLRLFKDEQCCEMMIDQNTKDKIDKNGLLDGKEDRAEV